MSTYQAAAWAGDFGDAYTERNRVDWRARKPFWQRIIDRTKPDTVFEVGCNTGWNLRALNEVSPGLGLGGIDVNYTAVRAANSLGLGFDVHHKSIEQLEDLYYQPHWKLDLVFTAGVLIHVAPQDLEQAMRLIIGASTRYVLAVEYEADEETEIEYRGQLGLLWKRPFGRLYQAMGLKEVLQIPPEQVQGFDRCTAWLMEKP